MGYTRRTRKTRLAMKQTNVIRYVERLGIQCDTTYDNNPYFFLFVEIDTKDKNLLQSMLKRILNQRIAVLWYETNKGYHIVSPSLIGVQKWLRLVKACQEIYPNPFYLHDVIRITKKKNDGKMIFSENADTKGIYNVSDNLVKIFELKYKCKLPFPKRVKTSITYTKYEDIELE